MLPYICALFVLAHTAVAQQADQQYQPLPVLPSPSSPSGADPASGNGLSDHSQATGLHSPTDGGSLSWGNFNYSAGNTYDLAGPQYYSDGLNKSQVTGIIVGCILGGLLLGALSMLCWLKRRRLFPQKFGPPKHPHEKGPVGPIDVLRSHSKLE
eukprot:gene6952-7168_t